MVEVLFLIYRKVQRHHLICSLQYLQVLHQQTLLLLYIHFILTEQVQQEQLHHLQVYLHPGYIQQENSL